jgi:UDP-N-acetylmuramate-alanine ligase
MRGVATDIGTIHFIGIGGIGMSGIAEVMHNLGYKVQGSTWPRAMSSRAYASAGSWCISGTMPIISAMPPSS